MNRPRTYGKKPQTKAQREMAAFIMRTMTDDTPLAEVVKRRAELLEGRR